MGIGSSTQSYYNVTNKSKSNTISISPRIGHFFSDNLAIGLGLYYFNSKYTTETIYLTGNTTYEVTNGNTSNDFGGGPFVRYYTNLGEKFKFFGELTTSISAGKSKTDFNNNMGAPNSNSISKYNTFKFASAIIPGFAFFPTRKWEMEFSFPLLSYFSSSTKDDGVNISSTAGKIQGFNFEITTFSPRIGVNYHF